MLADFHLLHADFQAGFRLPFPLPTGFQDSYACDSLMDFNRRRSRFCPRH